MGDGGIRFLEMAALRFKKVRTTMSGKVGNPFQPVAALGQKVVNSLGKTLFCVAALRFRKCKICAQKRFFFVHVLHHIRTALGRSVCVQSVGDGAFFEFGIPTGFKNFP